MGIVGDLLLWLKDYLSKRKQRVVINGVESSWSDVNAGVPQGSILGPLLFLIYINDIINEESCKIKLFADDTCIYAVVDNLLVSSISLNNNLCKINSWAAKWLVNFNPSNTESIAFSRKSELDYHPPLNMNGVIIKRVQTHKHLALGLTFSSDGTWNHHFEKNISKTLPRLNLLHVRRLKFRLDRRYLENMYFSCVSPLLEYVDVVCDNCPEYLKAKLEHVNYDAARIVTVATKLTSLRLLLTECGWETLQQRRDKHKILLFHNMVNEKTPCYLNDILLDQLETFISIELVLQIIFHQYPVELLII